MKKKVRIDKLMVEQGVAPTGSKAKAFVMAGIVLVDGKKVQKAGEQYPPTVQIELIKPPHPYVGRGGLKIEKALDHFEIDVKDMTCIDAGASTGGFTHCMLLRGAKKVYAVDVGYGQLDLKLRDDLRVVVLDRQNVRYLSEEHVPEKVDLISADLSFISLTLVIENLKQFLKPGGYLIPLIKPQFEADRKDSKKGVVRDPKVREQTVQKIVDFAEKTGFETLGTTESPIKGPSGNVEFLACFRLPVLTVKDAENTESLE